VYDKVNLSDTAAKRFNTLEFQAKHHTRLWLRDLYINMIGNYSSVQSKWSPFTVFNETAYLRHYSTQLEAYYALTSRLVLAQYAGYERMICNYKTETDAVTGRPRNQQGWGYAIGIDYDIARNTALFVRHRWFGFEDFSFQNDIYKGREIVVELKVAF
jgi:opacity protein-like surface antigen